MTGNRTCEGGCLDEEAVAGDARLLLRAFLPVRAVDIGRKHHSVARWRHQIAFDYDPARVRHPLSLSEPAVRLRRPGTMCPALPSSIQVGA